jgi:hypothetical protein
MWFKPTENFTGRPAIIDAMVGYKSVLIPAPTPAKDGEIFSPPDPMVPYLADILNAVSHINFDVQRLQTMRLMPPLGEGVVEAMEVFEQGIVDQKRQLAEEMQLFKEVDGVCCVFGYAGEEVEVHRIVVCEQEVDGFLALYGFVCTHAH